MAPKRKADSQTPAAAAAPSPSAKAKKKPNRRRKLKYSVRKRTSKKSSSASPAVKKAKKEPEEQQSPKETVATAAVADVAVVEAAADKSSSVRLVIEHCKQCTSFKNQAAKFEKSLKDKIQGLEISINPAKPRRGCFEVRDEEGNLFVSLLDLRRPFPELKALNVEEQVETIVSKMKK